VATWNELVAEVSQALDKTRQGHIEALSKLTGRNTIVYYSAWLQKLQAAPGQTYTVNDSDKNAFMATIHRLERDRGLDLVLHTPGGDIAATESLVDYLKAMFDRDIRVIVPQLAMSAGTMIALASQEILMGKHSSLGPIDPQINGLPAHAIVEEFEAAQEDIAASPANIPLWQPIIAKYSPTLIGQCKKAIDWSQEIVRRWLLEGMFADLESGSEEAADKVLAELGDPQFSKSHARHISLDRAREIGLNVTALEDDQELQEAVLTVHHACVLTLAQTNIVKLVENHLGVAHVSTVQVARSQ
jgi:hypothetical protein